MKKICTILLALVLACSLVSASASQNEETSALVVNLLLLELSKDDNMQIIFDLSQSKAFVDEDGDVMVNLEASSRIVFSLDPAMAHELVANLWGIFSDLHIQFSSKDLYLAVWYGNDILMYTGGGVVIDELNGGIHPFPTSI